MASTSSVPTASTSSENLPPNSSEPPTSNGDSTDLDDEDGPGRGRPETKLDKSAERGLIRLFVEAPTTSIESLAKALKACGGPGRLWLRKFYRNITGAGQGTDVRLKDIRLNQGDALHDDKGEDWGEYVSEFPNSEALEQELGSSAPHFHVNPSNSATSDVAEQSCSPRRTMSQRQRNMAYPPADATRTPQAVSSMTPEVLEQTTPASVPKPFDAKARVSRQDEPQRTLRGWQREEVHGNQHVRTDERGAQPQSPANVQSGSQVPRERTPDGPTTSKAGKNDRKRKLITSLTLTNMAKWLDGGKKGKHFRVVKERTVSIHKNSTISSRKTRTAASEFGQFYHRPGPNQFNPLAPSISTIPSTVFATYEPSPVRPEAVAANCLIDAWRHGREDDVVNRRLETILPERADERRSFVNAIDEFGASPLHLAVAYGYPHTCTFLLSHGADPKAVTNEGTNIYDFAEPAVTLAGEDLRLYYRILHCRTFVREGQSPPAPKHPRYPEHEKRNRKRLKKGMAKGPFCPKKPLHDETTAPQNTTASTHTNEPSTPATGETMSWYAWPYTESPRSSTLQRNRSVPSKNQPSMITLNALRRTTAAPPVPTMSFALPVTTEASHATPNAVATTISYGSMNAPSNNTADPHDQWYGNRRMRCTASNTQQLTSPIENQVPRLVAAHQVSVAQGSSQWKQTDPGSRSRYFAGSGRSHFDLGTSAHPDANLTSATTDFAQENFQDSRQYSHSPLSHTYQEPYTQPPVSNMTTSHLATTAGYPQTYWHQPAPPPARSQPNDYAPPLTVDATFRQPHVPSVPVAAHYAENPALYQLPSTNTDRRALEGSWWCIFNDPQCRSQFICRRCIQEYRKYGLI
jgi:hypothetical protein